MCCRYYYEDFEIELRELMKAEAVMQLPGFSFDKANDRDISPSQSAIAIHDSGSECQGINCCFSQGSSVKSKV